jgi:mono/diheme cytochrome c family protein
MQRLVILLQLVLLFLVGCKNEPPPYITDPGQLLYLGYTKEGVNCGRCHGPEGQGGMQAPDIRSIFTKYDEDKIVEIIELGKGQGSNAMPPFEDKINEEELTALMDFLKKSFSTDGTKSH